MKSKNIRADRVGEFRTEFDKNRKKILLSQSVCGICGLPVDKTLRWPNPMSATVDHIIPVDKGGHPSDMSNLQLAHFTCNRMKSDKLQGQPAGRQQPSQVLSSRVLPQSRDWAAYRA